MSKKDAYERAERELAAKQGRVQSLQQQKATLESQGRSLQEIAQLNGQIQSLQSEINRLQPQSQRLKKEYAQNQAQNQSLNYQVNNLNEQINKSAAQKNIYDDTFANIDTILGKHSEFAGQRIDPIKMIVQKLPQNEMHNSTAAKEACEKQSKEAFDQILKKTTDINATDSLGMSLLMYALKHGFWYGVDKLLELGADVNLTDEQGHNALHYASTMPHMASILKIIRQTNNVNLKIPESGDTPLHRILKNVGIDKIWSSEIPLLQNTQHQGGNLIITDELFFSGTFVVTGNVTLRSNIGGARNDGFTINQKKALLICKVLQSKGADFAVKDNLGLSPYFYICKNQQRYLIDQLKAEGFIDLEKLDYTGFEAAAGYLLLNEQPALKDFIKKHPLSLESTDANGDSLLHYAVQLRNIALISLLMDIGADQNLQNKNGLTPLFLSCAMKESNIAQYFIDKNPNVNLKDSNGFSDLYWAVELRDTRILQKLVDKGADINLRDNNGYTVLYWMAKYGWQNEATWLIAHGSYANIPDKNGIFPIHIAAALGHNEILKLLLNKDLKIGNATSLKIIAANKIVDVNIKHNNKIPAEMIDYLAKYNSLNQKTTDSNKVTPLYLAAQEGKLETVKLLVSLGADLNYSREDNVSPLHIAIDLERNEVAKELIARGANVNTAINTMKNKGETPMHTAVRKNNLDIVSLLMKAGANPNAPNDDKFTPVLLAMVQNNLELVKVMVSDASVTDTQGLSAWHYAAYSGNLRVAEYLRTKVKDIDHQTTESTKATALIIAAEQQQQSMLEWLISIGANINATKKGGGYTALMTAVVSQNIKTVEFLLSKGANANIAHSEGYYPIHMAASSNLINMINMLAKHTDINQKSNNAEQITPLWAAAQEGAMESVKTLISLGADVNAPRVSNGLTPLHTALQGGYTEVIKELIINGAATDIKDVSGNNLLHLISRLKGNLDVIKILLAKGFDIDAKNLGGGTAALQAIVANQEDTVKFLVANGAIINLFDNNGQHFWHYAAMYSSLEIIKLFKPYMMDIIDLKTKNAEQYTALWIAASAGKLDIVKWLIAEGADVDAVRISDGRTALQAAITNKHLQVAKCLIENGADINKCDNSRASPLYYSLGYAGSYDIEIVKYLILAGADVNKPMFDGDTPMHMVGYRANIEAMILLVKKGARIDAVNDQGKTPLHVLIEKTEIDQTSKLEATKMFLAYGARADIVNKEGESAITLAEKHLPEAVTLLEHPKNLPNIKMLEANFVDRLENVEEQPQSQQSSIHTDVYNKDQSIPTYKTAASLEKNTDNIYKDNALGDDRNLADNIIDPHYWYSVSDGCRLQWNLRETILHYNNVPLFGEEYAAYRENTNRVFLADPYYVTNFANYLKDDIARISATGIFSNLTSWNNMPTTIIIPLLAGLHWRVVKVDINYAAGTGSIALNDPYGAGGFSADLKSIIKEAIKINTQVLIRKQTGNYAFNITWDLPITEDNTDQQDRSNGWDCGPITFSNIKDYLESITGRKSELSWTIGSYKEQGHAVKIITVREADINAYMRVAGIFVNQERVNEAKDALEIAGKDLVKQAKIVDDSNAELTNELSNLDSFYLGILFEALESQRLISGLLSNKEPYSLRELKNAYKIVEAEVIKNSYVSAARIQQGYYNYNKDSNNSTDKNFKVNLTTDLNYSNKLLNHFELLNQAAKQGSLSLSEVLSKSLELDNELIEQVINTNDADLLLAGFISLEQTLV